MKLTKDSEKIKMQHKIRIVDDDHADQEEIQKERGSRSGRFGSEGRENDTDKAKQLRSTLSNPKKSIGAPVGNIGRNVVDRNLIKANNDRTSYLIEKPKIKHHGGKFRYESRN